MSRLNNMAADLAYMRVHGYELQNICHGLAVNAGWWNCPKTGEPSTPEFIHEVLVPKKLLLIHSEISEATEGHRTGMKDKHLPKRDAVEVELADAAIRIFDLAGALNYDLGAAIAEKLQYNTTRADHKPEARAAAGGKVY